MFYELVRFIFSFLYFFLFRLKVIGRENIPDSGAFIIASNHVSLLDPPTLGVACKNRRIDFMAKIELFKNPLFGATISRLGAFPVRRGMADRNAIKIALKRLNEGRILGIFPEGTRSMDGNLGKAEPGALALAVKTGTAIIPAAINGTEKVSLACPFPKITVAFGRPITIPADIPDREAGTTQLTGLMMQEIASLLTKIRSGELNGNSFI